jgi:hypothetical protein
MAEGYARSRDIENKHGNCIICEDEENVQFSRYVCLTCFAKYDTVADATFAPFTKRNQFLNKMKDSLTKISDDKNSFTLQNLSHLKDCKAVAEKLLSNIEEIIQKLEEKRYFISKREK